MILWSGDLDFWEQRQEYERRQLEEARRRARLDAERWLLQHQRQPRREQPTHDDHAREAHRAEGLASTSVTGDSSSWDGPITQRCQKIHATLPLNHPSRTGRLSPAQSGWS